jgi:hypothetical protein
VELFSYCRSRNYNQQVLWTYFSVLKCFPHIVQMNGFSGSCLRMCFFTPSFKTLEYLQPSTVQEYTWNVQQHEGNVKYKIGLNNCAILIDSFIIKKTCFMLWTVLFYRKWILIALDYQNENFSMLFVACTKCVHAHLSSTNGYTKDCYLAQ